MMDLRPYRKSIQAFCQRWHVKEFSLFGSVVSGDMRPDSDIDVLVNLPKDENYSLFDLVEMAGELERIFGRKVDLVEQEAIRNPFRRASIMSNKRRLYVA